MKFRPSSPGSRPAAARERYPRRVLTVADTAYAIAAVRADETELFSDPYAHRFVALGAHAEAGTSRFLALPFFRDGIRLRTRYIDDCVQAAIADGIDQVVMLGTGFDSRALRMPELARTRVFELDFPDQLDRKRGVLAGEHTDHITYVPCDLATHELGTALVQAGFVPARRAVVVWEGVTTYLGTRGTEQTLAALSAFLTAGSRVVFDAGWLPATGGFSRCDAVRADELWRRYLTGDPHPGSTTFHMLWLTR